MGRSSWRDKCPSRRFVFLVNAAFWIYLAAAFIIVGLCTNYWLEIKERDRWDGKTVVRFGLQRVCWASNSHCSNQGSSYERQNAVPVVTGMVATGGFLASVAAIMTLVNVFMDRLGRTKPVLSGASAGIATLSGIFLMVGVIYFSTEVDPYSEYIPTGHREYEGYSFGLVAASVGLMFIGAILNGCTSFSEADPVFN